jgi:glutamine amidotransferase
MCELLGLCFDQPVLPSLSFRGFRRRGRDNPHGWGVAAFAGGAAQVFKEPAGAAGSWLAEFVRGYAGLRSRVLIGHVRRASVGQLVLADTHPFAREVGGRELVVAHNGTLERERLVSRLDGLFTPVGGTDSEAALCALATWLTDQRVPFEAFGRLHGWLREINPCGTMNLLFSEGRRLYAYHHAGGYNGLWHVRRRPPYGRVVLRDDDWEVDLGAEKDPGQRGHVIAKRPLTDERWEAFTPGALLVFEDGETVYPA